MLICADVISERPGHTAGLFHAGALGQAIWLSATRAGLAGCAFGGACAEVTAAVQSGNPLLRHVFTVAMGHEVDPHR